MTNQAPSIKKNYPKNHCGIFIKSGWPMDKNYIKQTRISSKINPMPDYQIFIGQWNVPLVFPVIFILIFILLNIFFATIANGNEQLFVRVGVYENKPKIYTDPNGNVTGFWPELMEYIAGKENWNIKYIHGNWDQSLQRLLNGEIDIMPDVALTEKRDKIYAFSVNSVLISWSRLYVKKEDRYINSITDLENRKIAVLKGSVNVEGVDGIKELVQKFNINCTFLEFDSYDKVFEGIKNNIADAGVTNREFGNKNEEKYNLKKTAVIFQPINIKFAFTKRSSFTKHFSKRIDHHMEQLIKESDSFYYQLLEDYFETKIAEKTIEIFPMWIRAVLKGTGVLLIFLSLVIIISRIQVKRKTNEIEIKNEALRESEGRLRTLIDTIPDLVWLKDPDGIYLACNSKFESLFGAKEREIVGKTDYDFVDKELADLSRRKDRSAMLADKPVVNEEDVTYAGDGHSELLETIKTSMYDSHGSLIGVLGVSRDITQRKRLENLRKAKNMAEAANQAKSAFLANMSHELRTPLNAVLGFSQLMQNASDMPARYRKNLSIINSSGAHLLALINDILELSRIEAGKIELNAAAFDLHKLLNDIEDIFRFQTESKGLSLRIETDASLPRYVISDKGKLRQVLNNLLDNAIKFTKKGGILLQAHWKKGEAQDLCIEVKDTGIGIYPEEFDKIFLPFEQTMSAVDKGGTGLGLMISREYVRLMGGDLTAVSTPDQGTTFTVTCRIAEGRAKDMTITDEKKIVTGIASGQSSIVVLVVDDKKDNRELIIQLLQQVRIETLEAVNGKEAVCLFEKESPDLIFMDMRMPVMDGYEATRRIRKLPGGSSVKIIAVTASAFVEQHPMIKAAGCDDIASKPVNPFELLELVRRHIDVTLLYDQDQVKAVDEERGPEVDIEQLTGISSELRAELRQAAVMLLPDMAHDVIGRIQEQDPKVARALIPLVEEFSFNKLVKMLDSIIES